MKRFRVALAVVALAGLASSCRGPGWLLGTKKAPPSDAITIAASFYPIAEIVERVGGDKVHVVNLTPPGIDAHDVELTAKQVQQLQGAKITFYIGANFQTTLQKAIESVKGKTVDLLTSVDSTYIGGAVDPHVWLNPTSMIQMTHTVADALSAARPDLASMIASRTMSYVSELETVARKIDTSFTHCASTTLVTSHRSFDNFAHRARLTVRSLSQLNPDGQLSAQELETTVAELKNAHVTTVFSEEFVTNSLVKQVAAQLGATTDTLNPLEGITNADIKAGKNYVSVQMENIARIAKGLRCS